MPGFAHLTLGIVFGLLIYNTNPKQFTRKHALIFAFMSYLGPDISHILAFGINEIRHFGHSILGWPIYALLFVPIYTFLTRFTFDVKSLQLYDEGSQSPNRLAWWQVYLVMIAGGLFHFSVDITLETKRVWPYPMDDPLKINIETLKETLKFTTDHPSSTIILVSVVLIIIMFGLFNHFMKQSETSGSPKKLNIVIAIFVGIFIILYSIFGSYGEPDLGALVYFGIFYFGPFIIALFSFHPKDHDPKMREYDTTKGPIKLTLSLIYFLIIGVSVSVFAIVESSNPLSILEFIPNEGAQEIITLFYIPLTILIYLVAGLHFIIAFLLFKRHLLGQQLARFLLALLFIFMIPLIIWGLLREEEVLQLFETKK